MTDQDKPATQTPIPPKRISYGMVEWKIDIYRIARCRSCKAEIFFTRTEKGKAMPRDVATAEVHWATCKAPGLFPKKREANKS